VVNLGCYFCVGCSEGFFFSDDDDSDIVFSGDDRRGGWRLRRCLKIPSEFKGFDKDFLTDPLISSDALWDVGKGAFGGDSCSSSVGKNSDPVRAECAAGGEGVVVVLCFNISKAFIAHKRPNSAKSASC